MCDRMSSLSGITVLVLAREPTLLRALVATLTRAGARVRAFSSPEEALPFAVLVRVDAFACEVVSDGRWRDVEWIETARTIACDGSREAPALAIGSPEALDHARAASDERGFDEHVALPMAPGVLVARLRALLDARAAA